VSVVRRGGVKREVSCVWGGRELSRLFWKLNKSKDREKSLEEEMSNYECGYCEHEFNCLDYDCRIEKSGLGF